MLFTNLALLAIIAVTISTIGFQTYLLIQLPIILIASTFGLWLFYVQHQFESVCLARHEFWDPLRVALEGSSYFKLPKILQWFSGNIGLHHIHHTRPTIPNYNLQQCAEDIPAFQAVEPLTIRTSLKSLRLSLYDEEQKKLISFRSLKSPPLRGKGKTPRGDCADPPNILRRNSRKSSETRTGWTRQPIKAGSTYPVRLNEWRATEIGQIDKALDRIKENWYGVCGACRGLIDTVRLETSPKQSSAAPARALEEKYRRPDHVRISE